jgi:RNA polymerase sigma factor (sigma-70 family)
MATAGRRSALERSASHSSRDAVVREFLPLADALARRFQRRFPDLIELNDARQVARYELIRAAACLKPGCCTTAAFLKQRIHGALQLYLRDHGRPVRVSRREHEKGIHPWGHQSLDAVGPDERPQLDTLASPASEEPASSEGLGVSADALLQSLPAREAAILRLRVLEGQSLRAVSRELGISPMTVCRHEKTTLAALREPSDLSTKSAAMVVTDPPYLARYRDRTGRTLLNDDNDRWLLPAFAELSGGGQQKLLGQLLRQARCQKVHFHRSAAPPTASSEQPCLFSIESVVHPRPTPVEG